MLAEIDFISDLMLCSPTEMQCSVHGYCCLLDHRWALGTPSWCIVAYNENRNICVALWLHLTLQRSPNAHWWNKKVPATMHHVIFQLLNVVHVRGSVKARLLVWFIIFMTFLEHVHGAEEASGLCKAFFTAPALGKSHWIVYSWQLSWVINCCC